MHVTPSPRPPRPRSPLQGLASYGLTRVELLGAGLSNEGIDRLYRCMYVYTVGFFDVMQVRGEAREGRGQGAGFHKFQPKLNETKPN